MAFTGQQLEKINLVWERYLIKTRQPEDIRDQVDVGMEIKNQSIIIFEIRPRWDNPEEKINIPAAKTSYLKSLDIWKVYWMRGDLKWHPYNPHPAVGSFDVFLKVVHHDKYGCFWG